MQKYSVQLVDDLTNEVIEDGDGESVRFSIDGLNYMIDLTAENARLLRGAFKPYQEAARRAGGNDVATGRKKSAPAGPKKDLDKIREWANANGYKVSTRGRIAGSVVDAYEAAH
jgi:hypothetical protein